MNKNVPKTKRKIVKEIYSNQDMVANEITANISKDNNSLKNIYLSTF